MLSLSFWKHWLKEYRLIWYGVSLLFILSLIFLWTSYFQGVDNVIEWQRLQEQKVLDVVVHSFRLGPFELNVPGESYAILEYFQGGDIKPNTVASYIYLSILIASAVIILCVISTIERFWYFLAMALFIIFIISLRLEVVGLFGFYDKTIPAAVIALYVIPSFYLNRFRNQTPFIHRIVIYSLITIALGSCIAFYAAEPLPFFQLVLTSFSAGLVLSVLFMIMIAHEIIAGFVYVTSQGSSKSLRHLAIICTIYFVNVLITALHEIGMIDWNFIYINPYLLLTISAVLGIWGYKNREVIYGNVISYYPFGAYLFLAMGAISFVTTGHLLATANDPGVRLIRDGIIFTHAGYGFIFLLYLLSNFGQLLMDNKPVHKVLYSPRRMPYFTYRFAGLIATLAFIFYSNWRDYVYHAYSAFYNFAGDMYVLLDNEKYAESFYTQAKTQGFKNHRSNYALARIKASRFDFEDAHASYALANGRRPTEYSLTNAGNLYLWENNAFGAVTTYRQGLEKMPDSDILANNAGIAYAKLHKVDSATILLTKARRNSFVKNSAELNFFAMAAMEYLALDADSVVKVFDTDAPGTISNALAVSTIFRSKFDTKIDPLKDDKLDLYTATLLNNYIIRNAKAIDTLFINKAFQIASDPDNQSFSEALKSSLAFAYYHKGNISKALEILAEQVYLSQSHQGKFNYIMGLWALEQKNPVLASTYFTFADTYDYRDARFYNAIALTESGDFGQAITSWDSVEVHGDEGQQEIARRLKKILTLPASDAFNLNDIEKYQFCRYRIGIADSVLFDKLSNTFENANYQTQALLDISDRYLEKDFVTRAIHYYQRIAGLKLTDKNLYENARHQELKLLAYRGEVQNLATQLNKGIVFDASRNLEKVFYTALINEASGRIDEAKENYQILATYNPYFEEGVLAAYGFFRRQENAGLKPYNILAEAIQINANSLRLLKAYRDESARIGFDEYAISATNRIREIEEE